MKIKNEENLCIIKPPVTHSTVQYKILYSVCTLHFCTFAHISHFCTFAQISHFCTFAHISHFCTIALVHLCTCALVHLCTFALLHLCTFALLHFCTYFTILCIYTIAQHLHNNIQRWTHFALLVDDHSSEKENAWCSSEERICTYICTFQPQTLCKCTKVHVSR